MVARRVGLCRIAGRPGRGFIAIVPGHQDLRSAEAQGRGRRARRRSSWRCGARRTASSAERLKHLSRAVQSDPEERDGPRAAGPGRRTAGAGSRPIGSASGSRPTSQRGAKLAEYNGRRAELVEKERDLRPAVERLEGEWPRRSGPTRPGSRGTASSALAHANLGTLVRAERPEGRGDRPLHDGRAPRPLARGLLAAPRVRQAQRPVDQRRARPPPRRRRSTRSGWPAGTGSRSCASGRAGWAARRRTASRPRSTWRR